MTLQVLEIPEDLGQLADWLEARLLGLELGELVAELSAVHPDSAARPAALEDVLGEQTERVLVGGLKVLPPESVRQFLVRPRLLLELQERVFVEGGPYWERVASTPEVEELVERGWRGLEEKLGGVAPAVEEPPATIPLSRRVSWFARPWVVSLATAAAVLAGVLVYQHYAPPPSPTAPATAWGWGRPGALQEDLPAGAYLSKLADEADEWFAHRPEGDDRLALARSLTELREGCAVLILSPHQPLDEKVHDELVQRCRKWATQFDDQLAALEKGDPPAAVREKTDKTVRTLIGWLRGEAKKAAA